MSEIKSEIVKSETTTRHLQVKPDYYDSHEATQKGEWDTIQTNKRYKGFCQTHFTAGDPDQFQKYRDMTNGNLEIEPEEKTETEPEIPKAITWEKYKNLDPQAVDNTFNYIFHKFKKGCFIKFKNGKMSVFLPFSKKNFANEWGKKIVVDPHFKTLQGLIEYCQVKQGRKYIEKSINKFPDTWYTNNGLPRWEFPVHEGDTNISAFCDMFSTLVSERKVPDIEFFLNKRDFPIIRKDGNEPYNHIFGKNTPLISGEYTKYSPILSMVGSENYADIPIPTGDDWSRVSRDEGKYFPKTSDRNFDFQETLWKDKKPVAVFRGASTGIGTTPETNMRLKLALMSNKKVCDNDGLQFLDCGITEWNLRPRLEEGKKYLTTIKIENLPFGLVESLSPSQQAEYKYIINVDGHVSAFRLSFELSFGSVILIPDSEYQLWFRHMLKPFEHYVPLKRDLSDVYEKIRWCKANDSKCKKIAENAGAFYKKYLSREGILDYLQKLFYKLKEKTGVYIYPPISISQIKDWREREIFSLKKLNTKEIDIGEINDNYDFLKKVQKAVEFKIGKKDIGHREEFFQNKNRSINTVQINEYKIIEKTANLHEAFVNLYCINKLRKEIPNFSYCFGYDSEKEIVYTEMIQGDTLKEWLISDKFNFRVFLDILVQILLALEVAQQRFGFVHYDLTPWNIILKKVDRREVIYNINSEVSYSVKTTLIPVLIDTGRSHVVYKNYHYGEINSLKKTTIQDVLNILSYSIYELVNLEKLPENLPKNLITLANFISGSRYRKKQFFLSGKNGVGELKYFFGKSRKYSEIIYSDKYDLERYTPLDLVHYISEKFGVLINKKGQLYRKEAMSIVNYTETTFMYPERVLRILQNIKEDNEDVFTLKEICKKIYTQKIPKNKWTEKWLETTNKILDLI